MSCVCPFPFKVSAFFWNCFQGQVLWQQPPLLEAFLHLVWIGRMVGILLRTMSFSAFHLSWVVAWLLLSCWIHLVSLGAEHVEASEGYCSQKVGHAGSAALSTSGACHWRLSDLRTKLCFSMATPAWKHVSHLSGCAYHMVSQWAWRIQARRWCSPCRNCWT